jgi:hypothetical protein
MLLYQVFVGCPYKVTIRRSYDKLRKELEATTPLKFVMADTVQMTSSDDLLAHLKNLISDSAACIFDATDGNPNVSLEIGVAYTIPVDYVLAIKTRKSSNSGTPSAPGNPPPVKAIISDLQGKLRVEYKQYNKLRAELVARFLSKLPIMQRWNTFTKSNSKMVPFALKLFEDLRVSQRSQRPRLAANLEGSGFTPSQVISALRSHKLILSRRGPGGGYFYPTK